MLRLLLAALIHLLVASLAASAQASLTTTYASNNGSAGNMFDVSALAPIIVTGFDVNLAAGVHTVEVWTTVGGGSYVGLNQNPTAWTRVLFVGSVISNGPNQPTAVPATLALPIAQGQTRGFYVTTTGGGMRYTNGTSQGAVFAQNADLEIREGHGGGYAFALVSAPRVWNGTLKYVAAENVLTAVTSGNGVGDLLLSLTAIRPGALEGWILVSADTAHPPATGPLFGIFPDDRTFQGLTAPLTSGDPVHFPIAGSSAFPAQSFVVPPGTLAFLAGQTWDLVAVVVGPGFSFVASSLAVRIDW